MFYWLDCSGKDCFDGFKDERCTKVHKPVIHSLHIIVDFYWHSNLLNDVAGVDFVL